MVDNVGDGRSRVGGRPLKYLNGTDFMNRSTMLRLDLRDVSTCGGPAQEPRLRPVEVVGLRLGILKCSLPSRLSTSRIAELGSQPSRVGRVFRCRGWGYT